MSAARLFVVATCSLLAHSTSAASLLDATKTMEGTWKGQLEYRDYQSDAWTSIPASLTCEASDGGAVLTRTMSFQDPGRTVISKDVVLVDDAADRLFEIAIDGGRLQSAAYEVVDHVIVGPSEWRVVLETSGEDAGRPAQLRITQKLSGGIMTSRKDVRYADADDQAWLERNRTRFTRVEPDRRALEGTWQVDLRPTPDAEPYLQTLRIDAAEDGLRGAFYDAPIQDGRINDDWGVIHFAFTTTDGSGVYHTTGVLEGGRLRGTTHSLGRGFLSVWTAKRP